MLQEVLKRPFVRPLCLWITGIVFQIVFSSSLWLGGVFLLLLFIFLFAGNSVNPVQYDVRWIWGISLSLLIIILSMSISAYKKERMDVFYDPGGIKEYAVGLQSHFVESIDRLNLSDTEKSVLATLTLGYKKALPREVKKQFSITGVSHILAVSGFHVAIVGAFVSLLFAVYPTTQRNNFIHYLLKMGILWSFVFITGLAASAVRAALMLSFYLTGRVIRRNSDSYNTLAASAFCMLVYNPFYLFNIGFQLSYTAVFFILYIQPRLKSVISVRNPVVAIPWSWLTLTVAAQIGTAFLCLYYFSSFSVVSFFVNLPVILFATLLIPAGLIWLCIPDWTPGYSVLQSGIEWLTHNLVVLVERFSTLPGASVNLAFDSFSLACCYGIIGCLLLFISQRRFSFLMLMGLLLLILLLVRVFAKF